MNGTKEIAIRIENARTDFITSIVEQFNTTPVEAEKVLTVFKNVKAVKLDPVMGRYNLKCGAFWNIDVINNAINK